MRPVLSIAIPTYNRRDLLEFCLDRHSEGFKRFDFPYEIVISDNCSTDSTCEMVSSKIIDNPNIRLFKRDDSDAISNFINAIRKCRGDFIVYLADDDAIYTDVLSSYVHAMQHDGKIAGIYTDWIAYDDISGQELHRYFGIDRSVRFEPEQTGEMLDFLFAHMILPEIGIWRREAFLNSRCTTKRQYPFHMWLYNLARTGSIVFSNIPFYKENRLVRKDLSRGDGWVNMSSSLSMIGDEMRISLENLLCLYNVDHFDTKPSDAILERYRLLIERWLHSRVMLEVNRAVHRKDWILAVELRRRLVLTNGFSSKEEQINDYFNLTLPASFQQILSINQALSGIRRILFHHLPEKLYSVFRSQYPELEVQLWNDSGPAFPNHTIVVSGSINDPILLDVFSEYPGHLIDFNQILKNFRTSNSNIPI